MWGQILLESSIQQNFNFGFSSSKSDILIHLSQWQYWWWFWFSLIWVAYYYIIIYVITKRSMNFNPIINTSLRGHGKWGDFLVALIPLSWCGNILVNSNFILRMIEWQNESSLFTLRVQGKQWYWVYKYDATAVTAILAAPKNIGHNKWFTRFLNETYVADSYYQAIHLAAQLEFQQSHKTIIFKNNLDKDSLEPTSFVSNKLYNMALDNHQGSNFKIHEKILDNYLTQTFKQSTNVFKPKKLVTGLDLYFSSKEIDNYLKTNTAVYKLKESLLNNQSAADYAKITKLDNKNLGSIYSEVQLFGLHLVSTRFKFLAETDLAGYKFSLKNINKNLATTLSMLDANTKHVTLDAALIKQINVKFYYKNISNKNIVDLTTQIVDNVKNSINIKTQPLSWSIVESANSGVSPQLNLLKNANPELNSLVELGFKLLQKNNSSRTQQLLTSAEHPATKLAHYSYLQLLVEAAETKPKFKIPVVTKDTPQSESTTAPHYYNIKTPGNPVHYDYAKLDDASDVIGNLRASTPVGPLRLVEGILNSHAIDMLNAKSDKLIFFNWKFYETNDTLEEKTYQAENLWGFRQKKYKRLKKFTFAPRRTFNPVTFESTVITEKSSLNTRQLFKNKELTSVNEFFNDNLVENTQGVLVQKFHNHLGDTEYFREVITPEIAAKLQHKNSEPFDFYKAIKNSKHRADLLSVTLARRLLRTKRTLVLPAHINITVITNSYDVVHSWFIPGLGIKMDCVPGRSTHHTFYIDNIGFYYGQCAEICGRYHHHMPIRICALPFEHFLVWWHKKGLPRMNRLNMQGGKFSHQNYYNNLSSFDYKKLTAYKYTW